MKTKLKSALTLTFIATIGITALTGCNQKGDAKITAAMMEYIRSQESSSASPTPGTTEDLEREKANAEYLFDDYSVYVHEYSTQNIDFAANLVSLPAEMIKGDSRGRSGTLYEWKRGHHSKTVGLGESFIIIGGDASSYLDEFKKIYEENSHSYYVNVKGNTGNEPSFKQMCEKSLADIKDLLSEADVNANDYVFDDGYIWLDSKSKHTTVSENYYMGENVFARNMVIYNALHGSLRIKMLKVVNTNGDVRVIYGEYFNNTSLHHLSNIYDLHDFDLSDMYEIEQTIKQF